MPAEPRDRLAGTWRDARPGRIRRVVRRRAARDPGGWYVVGASTDVGATRSVTRTVAGREVVLWRDEVGGPAGRARRLSPPRCPARGLRGDARPGLLPLARPGPRRGRARGGTGHLRRARRRRAALGASCRREGETPTDRPTLTTRPPVAQPRSRPSSRSAASASRRTSSPTGSTRGTAPGTTPMRSATSPSTTTPATDEGPRRGRGVPAQPHGSACRFARSSPARTRAPSS